MSRDINICQVGIKEAEKAVNEASCVLQQLCQDFKEFEKKGRFVSRTWGAGEKEEEYWEWLTQQVVELEIILIFSRILR